jgi:hypothetical protein
MPVTAGRSNERSPSDSTRSEPLLDGVNLFRNAGAANERLLAATVGALINTISDPQSPTVIKFQLVYAIICALSFSICSMFFCVNAIGSACCSIPLEVDHYLIFMTALIIIFLVPMFYLTIKAAPVSNTYNQISNLTAVTRARQFHMQAPNPSG